MLGPEIGAVRVGFAKVPVKSTGIEDGANTIVFPSSNNLQSNNPQALANALIGVQGVSDIPVEQQIASGQTENYRSNLMINLLQNGSKDTVLNAMNINNTNNANNNVNNNNQPPKLEEVTPDQRPSVNDQQMIMSILSAGHDSRDEDIKSVSEVRPVAMYYTSIPAITPMINIVDNQPIRKFDASKLRELRKRLENNVNEISEINEEDFPFSEDPEILATKSMSEGGIIDNIVDLASDYIGNTIIQKLFEVCSLDSKLCMLNELAPHLAMIGCHKVSSIKLNINKSLLIKNIFFLEWYMGSSKNY